MQGILTVKVSQHVAMATPHSMFTVQLWFDWLNLYIDLLKRLRLFGAFGEVPPRWLKLACRLSGGHFPSSISRWAWSSLLAIVDIPTTNRVLLLADDACPWQQPILRGYSSGWDHYAVFVDLKASMVLAWNDCYLARRETEMDHLDALLDLPA